MKRPTWNLLIDLAAAGLFLGMLVTGYMIRFPLPPGTNKILTLWGLTRHSWGTIHTWIGFGLGGLLMVHLALHWHWLLCMVRRQFFGRTAQPRATVLTGMGSLLVLLAALGLLVWFAHASVREITVPIAGVCPPNAARDSARASVAERIDGRPVAFWKDVYPILERNCQCCHGPQKASAGFRIDRQADYFTSAGREPLVRPGDSEHSPLLDIVAGKRKDMALAERHLLTTQDVAVLRAWIDAGAPWPDPRQPTADDAAVNPGRTEDFR